MAYRIIQLKVSIVPNANYREAFVKYTTVLPKECLNELKALTEKKVIPSVSQGIRRTVEDFVTVQNWLENSGIKITGKYIDRRIKTR
jgi:hypothetical protein